MLKLVPAKAKEGSLVGLEICYNKSRRRGFRKAYHAWGNHWRHFASRVELFDGIVLRYDRMPLYETKYKKDQERRLTSSYRDKAVAKALNSALAGAALLSLKVRHRLSLEAAFATSRLCTMPYL